LLTTSNSTLAFFAIAALTFSDIRNLPTKINGLSWNSMRYDNIFRKVMK
jgi:hypothetical protein